MTSEHISYIYYLYNIIYYIYGFIFECYIEFLFIPAVRKERMVSMVTTLPLTSLPSNCEKTVSL